MTRSRLAPALVAGLLGAIVLAGCSAPDIEVSASPSALPVPTAGVFAPVTGDRDAVFAMLEHTVGYSSLDHSPVEGAWNYPLAAAGFTAIADAGFTAVRLPVRFSAHQQMTPPYTIDEDFLTRVDWAIDQALSNGLAVIVDNHHWGVEGRDDFDTLFTDPASQKDRLEAIWEQVGARYADRPAGVVFELMNEPHDDLDTVWNEYLADLLDIVRDTNPGRTVIVGPGSWNGAFALDGLELPDDVNLIVTFHDYLPFDFTHQGATWVGDVPPVGVIWPAVGLRLSGEWADWSWDNEHSFTSDGIDFQATGAWAGLYLHSDTGVLGATSISLTTSTATDLWVDCGAGDGTSPSVAVVTTTAAVALPIDTAACGLTDGALHDIRIMVGENASAHFVLTSISVTNTDGSASLFTTSENETSAPLEHAAAWAQAHGDVPIFVGEFGASHLGDQASRDAWVRFVRGTAEDLGMAWSYWDFQGDWGFWTPSGGVTNPWLVDALFDN